MRSATELPERCVIVVDEELPPGLAANAAAVLALTLGSQLPVLVGPPYRDADANEYAGLFGRGLPVLRATAAELQALLGDAYEKEVGVITMPAAAQQTTDYEAFRARMAETPIAEVAPLALLLHGPKRAIAKLTGRLSLLR